jgi:RNA polymerase sigma-70 factor (ECF subfamily)
LRNPQSHSQARPGRTVEGASVAISISVAGFDGSLSTAMEPSDAEVIAAVLAGHTASFEHLIRRYSSRVFATARRYARRESEVEDIAQEVWSRAFQKLSSFRAEAPFEHWLMRMTVRVCYDFLREHQRNRETSFSELSVDESDWLERFVAEPDSAAENADAARQLVRRILERLSPAARMVITLLEIEEKSVKEIAALTGWSVPLVKVRAFRARAEMRKELKRLERDKYL